MVPKTIIGGIAAKIELVKLMLTNRRGHGILLSCPLLLGMKKYKMLINFTKFYININKQKPIPVAELLLEVLPKGKQRWTTYLKSMMTSLAILELSDQDYSCWTIQSPTPILLIPLQ